MIAVHRGAGMLVPLLGILSALFMNIFTIKAFGDDYYQEHHWPKLMVLVVSGAGCLACGLLFKRYRAKRARKEEDYIASLSPKSEVAKELAFSGPRDHLMYLPLQYWSLVYWLAAAVYAFRIR
jgi:hypothetical protein